MYECPRCHYQTQNKKDLKTHFFRKKTCLPIYENIPPSILQKKVLARNAYKIIEKENESNNSTENTTDINENTQISHNETQNQMIKYECKYCKKILSRADSLKRHVRICKVKIQNEKEKNDTKNIIIEKYQQQVEILQEEIKKLSSKANIVNNYYTQNNFKQEINNDIKINAFREENIDYLTPEYIMSIAKRGMYYAIPKLIEKIYFNENHPENQNVKITNERSKYAQIYDGTRFVKCAKNLIVRDMIRVSIDIIDEVCCDVDMPVSYNTFSKKYDRADRELMNSLYKKAEGIALTYSKN